MPDPYEDFLRDRFYQLKKSAMAGVDITEAVVELTSHLDVGEDKPERLLIPATYALAEHYKRRGNWDALAALMLHPRPAARKWVMDQFKAVGYGEPTYPVELVSTYVQLLRDKDSMVRDCASSALLHSARHGGDMQPLRELDGGALQIKGKRIRENLAKALAADALERNDVAALDAMLAHNAPRVRWSAVQAVEVAAKAGCEVSGHAQRLVEACADPHKHVRKSAHQALEAILGEETQASVRSSFARCFIATPSGKVPPELRALAQRAQSIAAEPAPGEDHTAGQKAVVWAYPPSTHPRRFSIMRKLVSSTPLDVEALSGLLAGHSRFVERGGLEGHWTTMVTRGGLVMALYMGADASGQASLQHSNLDGVSMAGVYLPAANLVGVRCENQDLTDANLQGAMAVDGFWGGSIFRGADLSYADFSRCDLMGCDFRGANLESADLENADLSGADLTGARIVGARFRGARLVQTRLPDVVGSPLWFAITGETWGSSQAPGDVEVLAMLAARVKGEHDLAVIANDLFEAGVIDRVHPVHKLLYDAVRGALGF